MGCFVFNLRSAATFSAVAVALATAQPNSTVAATPNTAEEAAPDVPFCDADGAPSASTQLFLLNMGMIVFFMHAGFALLEAGSVGVPAVTNILFKNVINTLIGAVAWWWLGYWFAFGTPEHGDTEHEISNSGFFFGPQMPECMYSAWFFQWTFSATTTTITSGAVAGRIRIVAFVIYCFFMTAFVYPVVVHWVWSDDAWLTTGANENEGYRDFAGSGVVHVCGGIAALVGAIAVGPRYKTKALREQHADHLRPHSIPFVVLGTLILTFGFFAFNGGSQLTMDSTDDAIAMSRAVVNTILAAAGGGLTALAITRIRLGRWQLAVTCNGMLAGMVSICAGANVVWPWAAFVIGVVGGAAYCAWSIGLIALDIDDAIDASPVHLGAGIWGCIAVPLFSFEDSVFYHNSSTAWNTLGWQFAGVLTIIVWSGTLCGLLFVTLNYFGMLRCSDADILTGLDEAEHGEKAYVAMIDRGLDSSDPIEMHGAHRHGDADERGATKQKSSQI